jgi:hypothetical protein
MKLEKLRTINERQYERLRLAGIEVGMKTTVHEVLKFLQTLDAVELINLDAPMYCRIYVSAYYVAEVAWYGEINEGTSGWLNWYSMGVHSWEDAESLALDYMLGTLEMPELHNTIKYDKIK